MLFAFYHFRDGLRFNITLLIYYADFQSRSGAYTVGDFMTKREDLHVVKPTTTVDEGIADTWASTFLSIL